MRRVKPHVTHWRGCDCREARFEAMEEALQDLLRIQGEIHPGWNDEYIRAAWVREIAEDALKQGSPSPTATGRGSST